MLGGKVALVGSGSADGRTADVDPGGPQVPEGYTVLRALFKNAAFEMIAVRR